MTDTPSLVQHETLRDYHADTSAVTNSAKEVYRQSPALYHGQYVARSIPFDPSTPAQLLGSLVHTIILEPEQFDALYMVAPESCKARSGKAWTMTAEEAEERGTTPILVAHAEQAVRMAEVVKIHPVAAKVLSSAYGVAEQTIRWTEPMSGLPCKCRPDWLIDATNITAAICVDVKTAEEPSPAAFSRAAAKYGYHRQAAWYMDGIEAAIAKPARWIFVAVGKSEPFDVWVYQLALADITLGRQQNARIVAELAASIATNVWTAPGQLEIQTLELPKWARSEDDE